MSEEPKIGKSVGNMGKGRPKGAANKTTALLKDAIIAAATEAGQGDLVAYLKLQAINTPGPFLGLIGKVLPLQIGGDPANPVTIKVIDWRITRPPD